MNKDLILYQGSLVLKLLVLPSVFPFIKLQKALKEKGKNNNNRTIFTSVFFLSTPLLFIATFSFPNLPGQQFSSHSSCVFVFLIFADWRQVCWSPTCATSCVIKSSTSTQPFHSHSCWVELKRLKSARLQLLEFEFCDICGDLEIWAFSWTKWAFWQRHLKPRDYFWYCYDSSFF